MSEKQKKKDEERNRYLAIGIAIGEGLYRRSLQRKGQAS
jgi:hypothetical protein